MSDKVYPIKRIRLINFHNFVDETVELEDGGHLFLLGDNGCGKTTILDAVHYVLTAGKGMEWNSAARLSGTKRDGRRVQGIVLRYNLDTGIMNAGGAITYVALEIVGRNGKLLSIGMGLSATALDEKIGFWGFIKECILEDLPFTTEEDGQIRPSSRQEFKQRLDSSRGLYTNKAAYQKDLGDRLFGGEESYHDICRFLSMGKSYREISAGAADYHQLFKSLLPEPRTSLFEQIIESLRSLDESQTLLDDLERKLGWLSGLNGKLIDIAESRQGILRYKWLLHHFTLQKKEAEERKCHTNLEDKYEKINNAQATLTVLEEKSRELDERLHNLQSKDSSGLVRQEKSCQDEFSRKKTQLQIDQAESSKIHRELKKNEKERDKIQENLKKKLNTFLPELARCATSIPFPITEFQAEIDTLSRLDSFSDITEPAPQQIVEHCDHEIQIGVEERTLLDHQIKLLDKKIALKQETVERLEERSEIVPQLAGYENFERAMRNAMLTPRPLFQGLEWAPSVKLQVRQYIEECIGEEILATQLLRKAEYEKARELCTNYPGLRICSDKHDNTEISDWMRQVFDLKESDPSSLLALAMEMESSGWQPEVSMIEGKPILAFRGHERRLHGAPARLIGCDSRKKALAAEIRSLHKELQQLGQEKKDIQKEHQIVEHNLNNVSTFKKYIIVKSAEIRTNIQGCQEAAHVFTTTQQHYDTHHNLELKLKNEVTALEVQLHELGELIAKKGLANLEKRIKKIKNQRDTVLEQSDELKGSIGGDRREISQLEQSIASIRKERISLTELKEAVEQRLRETLEPGTDAAHYILKTKKGQQFKRREAIQKEIESCRVDLGTGINNLKVQVNDPEFGGAFRFTYDEEKSQLYNYRQEAIAAIIIQQTDALNEQQGVINDRTRELFKKIIMTDLMQYLRGHVGEMEDMVRKINNLLRSRSFGGQQYSFKIRPLDEFKQLINIIRNTNPFDPAGEQELAAFFEDHRDAIIATESGAIPDELDYRNWYRYEMVVSNIGDEGKVIDRRNKSLGSGGEQAVPNYLLILTIAHFMYRGKKIRLHTLLFDEAFYGIDAGRRDQILGFATDLQLQLFIASPDQDGVRREVRNSTTILVKKDTNYDVHLFPFHWKNPSNTQMSLLDPQPSKVEVGFGEEL
ncbi:ATP-binding protein [Desulfosediminicola sp.]|uniref:ATP-binding protein n=1 Tax=Desulfosediminicola sp. TaxID=2886825 RepID=UPI003AF30B2F